MSTCPKKLVILNLAKSIRNHTSWQGLELSACDNFFIHLSWQHFLSSTWRNTSFFRADAVSNNNLDTVAFLRLKKMNKVWICFRQQFHGRKLVAVVSLVAELNKRYARKHNTDTDCMFMSYHLGVSEWIHTLWFPECQGTPCSKQTRKSLNECNWTRTQNHLSS